MFITTQKQIHSAIIIATHSNTYVTTVVDKSGYVSFHGCINHVVFIYLEQVIAADAGCFVSPLNHLQTNPLLVIEYVGDVYNMLISSQERLALLI